MAKLTLREHQDGIWLHVDNANGLNASVNLGRRDPDSIVQRALTIACSDMPHVPAVPALTDAQSKQALSAAVVEVAALKGQCEALERRIEGLLSELHVHRMRRYDVETHRRYAHIMQEQRSKIAEYCSLLEKQIEALKPGENLK